MVLVIVGVTGPPIAAALGLSLIIMAGISLVLLRRGLRAVSVSVEPVHLSIFKGQTASSVLTARSPRPSLARVSSVVLHEPYGLRGELGRFDRGASELALTPRYAGSFDGLRVSVILTDVLGLYTHSMEFGLELTVDSLPKSLLLPESPMPVSAIVQGEVSTGGRGWGQELYSVEPYSAGSDAKDVMWKRMARSEDEKMQVRVREASARANVTILWVTGELNDEEQVARTDQAAEAMAQLGKRFVSLGVTVDLVHSHRGGVSYARASNLAELVTGVMHLWKNEDARAGLESLLLSADLLVIGQEVLTDGRVETMLGERPILVLREVAGQPWSGGTIFSFSGEEDLSQLVEVLLER